MIKSEKQTHYDFLIARSEGEGKNENFGCVRYADLPRL